MGLVNDLRLNHSSEVEELLQKYGRRRAVSIAYALVQEIWTRGETSENSEEPMLSGVWLSGTLGDRIWHCLAYALRSEEHEGPARFASNLFDQMTEGGTSSAQMGTGYGISSRIMDEDDHTVPVVTFSQHREPEVSVIEYALGFERLVAPPISAGAFLDLYDSLTFRTLAKITDDGETGAFLLDHWPRKLD